METKTDIYPRIKNYLSNTHIENYLNTRVRNNEDVYFNCSKEQLKVISDIDEYFYLLMNENTINQLGSPLNKYIEKISKQIESNPLLLLSLPIWKLDKNKLRKYLSNYDRIMTRINQIEKEANYIYRKFELNPTNLTIEELKKLVTLFLYSIPYADQRMYKAQENVAKYLLSNPKDTKYNYEISLFLIKFFGYKKIREEKLENTKIIFSELPTETYGESTENYVIINKQLLHNVIMENNHLDDRFGRKQNRYIYHEMLGILHTMYHEVRHQTQRKHNKANEFDDLSYYYASFKLINQNSSYDYEKNYKCYEIEKDANYKAWEDLEKLIKTYMTNRNTERIMKNILNHKLKEELLQITGVRRTPDNREYLSKDLLIKYLDDIFRTNPYLLRSEYKQFLNFYNPNGIPKRAVELLTQPLIYKYKDFFFGQTNYRARYSGYRLTSDDLKRLSSKEIQTVINNMKILMDLSQEKLNKICDRVRKYNVSGNEVAINIKNYHEFAMYISKLTNQILQQYPDLKNILSIKNAINSINDNIEMINRNSIVIKVINDNNQISKIGRR